MHNTYDYDAYDAYDDIGGIPQDPGRGLDHKSGTFKPQGDPVHRGRGRIDAEKLGTHSHGDRGKSIRQLSSSGSQDLSQS
jgi:hypothetical protein